MKALLATAVLAATLVLAGCGGANIAQPTTTGNGPSVPAASRFSIQHIPAPSPVGNVVVDGHGFTVYVLTSAAKKNVPCTDASGCTGVWPDPPLPKGMSAATADTGLDASLLGTTKLSDGETYPTYNGYLMYEYSGDNPGQANGQGLKSYGGTWYVLSASGNPVTTSGSSGGYGYP
jgi:predicted lipoprotein with Yx(FWY)xxD motif